MDDVYNVSLIVLLFINNFKLDIIREMDLLRCYINGTFFNWTTSALGCR